MITGCKFIPAGTKLPASRRPRWFPALVSWVIVAGAGALVLILLGRLPPKGIPADATNATYART
jgi:hypothetical protein